MRQSVLPIKDSDVLKEVQETLLYDFNAGQRNYTIFQVSKANLVTCQRRYEASLGRRLKRKQNSALECVYPRPQKR
ncbi:hypothetical protein J8137_02495 [Lactiplantibacillus plantarum]|nr:hypothetical protein [Lactiplantibacillus plantarum]